MRAREMRKALMRRVSGLQYEIKEIEAKTQALLVEKAVKVEALDGLTSILDDFFRPKTRKTPKVKAAQVQQASAEQQAA